ncbi:MAG: glycoside hydrolase family 97 catalytic domain-containing protein [Flavisolibacter sp.]
MRESKVRNIFIIILVLVTGQGLSQSLKLSSPDGNLRVSLQTGNQATALVRYDLSYKGHSLLQHASIGFELDTGFASSFILKRVDRKQVSATWEPVYGERKHIPENYRELLLRFHAVTDPALGLTIICRVYNEGFAFQYRLVRSNTMFVLNSESSRFSFPGQATAWVSTTAQGLLLKKNMGQITGIVERPLTVKTGDGLFAALGEAGLVNFARMKFARKDSNSIVTQLDGKVMGKDSLISPWRYVLAGKEPSELLENNYLVLNLNAPNQIRDTRWIKPGKVIREATLTTEGAFTCIDFAKKHGIQYILFDAGWYGKEDSDTSDATRVSIDPARYRGPLDLKKVIAYGNQKKVGILLYVNRRALERQLDTLLPLYRSWGVKGLKFGFVQVGSQKWTSWLHEAVRKAAKYKLMVDIHDEYRSTGYSRTFPNLLTQEGVRGDEENPSTAHSITTLFTRMIAGAADNTNCYFTNHVAKMGSHGAQLAKSVCLYSPLQFLFWYDRPVNDSIKTFREGEIRPVPEMDWFNSLPTTWDKTCVLEGDMSAYATIARKNKSNWFIGSLNGSSERNLTIPCSFLDRNRKYTATIYEDDSTVQTATQIKITRKKINRHTVLHFTIATGHGMAIRIVPDK